MLSKSHQGHVRIIRAPLVATADHNRVVVERSGKCILKLEGGNGLRRSAFTLAESMMALLISMVTVLALGQTIKIVDQVNQRALDMPTDWYLFVTELELSDRHFSLYRCQDEQHAVLYGLPPRSIMS